MGPGKGRLLSASRSAAPPLVGQVTSLSRSPWTVQVSGKRRRDPGM